MKQITLYHFILQRHLRQLLLAVVSIFLLSTVFFLFSAQYRAQQHAHETVQFISSYLDTFLDSYLQQSKNYDQDQNIRNLFSNLRNSGTPSAEALEGMASPIRLSAHTILCIDGTAIWPADAALPDGLIPVELAAPAFFYSDNLYFVTPYYNFFQTEQLGAICYLIPAADFEAYIARFAPPDLPFSLADATGTVFFSVGNISSGQSAEVLETPAFSCSVYPDLSSEMQTVGLLLLCLLLVCAIVLAFGLLRSRQVAAQLSAPIYALTRQLQHNQSGNLDMPYPIPSPITEINLLTQAYAELLSRLQNLITQNQKQNLLRMEAELTLLQTQIDPHFLFNTLEIINSQALLESADKTAEMVQRLGTLFRYTLRAPEMVPLERELQCANDYCFLQNIHRDEPVGLAVICSPAAAQADILLPKLTLQPILENSFRHGFSDRDRTDYQITITVQLQEDFLLLSVHDNGVGITQPHIISSLLHQALFRLLARFSETEKRGAAVASNHSSAMQRKLRKQLEDLVQLQLYEACCTAIRQAFAAAQAAGWYADCLVTVLRFWRDFLLDCGSAAPFPAGEPEVFALQFPDAATLENTVLHSIANHAASETQHPTYDKILSYINRFYAEPLSLQHLSQVFHLNQAYLGQLIKKSSGLSFHTLLNEIRLEKAIQILQENRAISIKDLAVSLGFSDAYYFTRVFKQRFGVAPSEYRRSLQAPQ